MKILHQLGHNHKWSLDAYFKNGIGDGFVFCAYSFKNGFYDGKVSGYDRSELDGISLMDLQFYGNKDSVGGKLETYVFHPINCSECEKTSVDGVGRILSAIEYQHRLGMTKIVIPNFFYAQDDFEKTAEVIKNVNRRLKGIKKDGCQYYMTVCFSLGMICDDEYVERMLREITSVDVRFDGYYVACEPVLEYKKKISTSFKYYENLLKVFKTLKAQEFYTIFPYANWDSVVFCSLAEIDCVTIGTYENLRRFNVGRYVESAGGGPSEGWYFSEKLLNVVKAQELIPLRIQGALPLIANEGNVFSDAILDPRYEWNVHKPEVQKNYLLAIFRLLDELRGQPLSHRVASLLGKIEKAREIYRRLEGDHSVYLQDETSDYYLSTWTTFLKMHQGR